MIRLPPGCSINYEVTIVINNMPDEFLAWWEEIGGTITWNKYYTRTKEISVPQLQYGKSRPSHKLAGNEEYLLRFRQDDATVGLMLIMKWTDLVVSHNFRDVEKYLNSV